MAPQAGFEPATTRLTAERSTTELLWNDKPGNVLLSQGVAPQLPSALKSLTSVFGMGTGVSSSLSPPDLLLFSFNDKSYYINKLLFFKRKFSFPQN
jgi:hypothetical protein